jgi:hypothetical protein
MREAQDRSSWRFLGNMLSSGRCVADDEDIQLSVSIFFIGFNENSMRNLSLYKSMKFFIRVELAIVSNQDSGFT